MEDEVDPYQSLAAILLAACPADSSEIRLSAELDEGWAQLDLRCVALNGQESRSPLDGAVRLDIHENLDNIRNYMNDISGRKWKSCVFSIKDGKFNMAVGY